MHGVYVGSASWHRSPSRDDRHFAAGSDRTSPSALAALAGDDDRNVRLEVAANPRAPADALRALAAQADGLIWVEFLDDNPATPADAFGLLCASDDAQVQEAARARSAPRVAERFGVPLDNTEAIAALCDQRWWEMTPESPEVRLCLDLFPNP